MTENQMQSPIRHYYKYKFHFSLLSDMHFLVWDGLGAKKCVSFIIILLRTAQKKEQAVQHFCLKGSTVILEIPENILVSLILLSWCCQSVFVTHWQDECWEMKVKGLVFRVKNLPDAQERLA